MNERKLLYGENWVGYCPLRKEGHYPCILENCAWWDGDKCATMTLATMAVSAFESREDRAAGEQCGGWFYVASQRYLFRLGAVEILTLTLDGGKVTLAGGGWCKLSVAEVCALAVALGLDGRGGFIEFAELAAHFEQARRWAATGDPRPYIYIEPLSGEPLSGEVMAARGDCEPWDSSGRCEEDCPWSKGGYCTR